MDEPRAWGQKRYRRVGSYEKRGRATRVGTKKGINIGENTMNNEELIQLQKKVSMAVLEKKLGFTVLDAYNLCKCMNFDNPDDIVIDPTLNESDHAACEMVRLTIWGLGGTSIPDDWEREFNKSFNWQTRWLYSAIVHKGLNLPLDVELPQSLTVHDVAFHIMNHVDWPNINELMEELKAENELLNTGEFIATMLERGND
jgi:hypothetical protein